MAQCNITSEINRDRTVVSFQKIKIKFKNQFFHLVVVALGHYKLSSRIFIGSTKTEKGNEACPSRGRLDKHGLRLNCFLAKQELLDHLLQNQSFL